MAVDALVALIVLSSTLACAMVAANQGLSVARLAAETRRATDLLAYLLETAPREPGVAMGFSGDFSWRRTVSDPRLAIGAAAVCVRSVRVQSIKSRRLYEGRTSVVCARGGA